MHGRRTVLQMRASHSFSRGGLRTVPYRHRMAADFSSPTDNEMPWLVRADFTDQVAWEQICRAVLVDPDSPDENGQVGFVIVDDIELDGLTPARLLELEPHEGGGDFLVDHQTMSHPDRPVVAVDVADEPGRSFRLIPTAVQSFAVNMLLANMDFDDFANSVDADGIFRGFGPIPVVAALPEVQSTPTQAGPVGSIADLIREADPDQPNSFVGELIREAFWNPASWQRLETGMREACRMYNGSTEVPRALTRAFHSVMVRVPNLVMLPRFLTMGMDPTGLEARLNRISVLSSWFFRGWTLTRPEGPLPGEYDPNVSSG